MGVWHRRRLTSAFVESDEFNHEGLRDLEEQHRSVIEDLRWALEPANCSGCEPGWTS
jgi:hypothetical protein